MAMIIRTRRILGRANADINITPLIDVLLVLIVIFMVITPLTPQGLEANVPQPSPKSLEPERENTLILSLSYTGSIRLNQEEVAFASVLLRLQEVLRTRADRTLFVQADNDVLYDDVTQLIDLARGAGADRIGLMTQQVAAR